MCWQLSTATSYFQLRRKHCKTSVRGMQLLGKVRSLLGRSPGGKRRQKQNLRPRKTECGPLRMLLTELVLGERYWQLLVLQLNVLYVSSTMMNLCFFHCSCHQGLNLCGFTLGPSRVQVRGSRHLPAEIGGRMQQHCEECLSCLLYFLHLGPLFGANWPGKASSSKPVRASSTACSLARSLGRGVAWLHLGL